MTEQDEPDGPELKSNYETIGFHGTSSEAKDLILRENFSPSRGDDHWLGEGVYFFETGISDGCEDAKKWGAVSSWDNTLRRFTYKHYAVIKAQLKIPLLWDLTTQEGLLLLQGARELLRKRIRESGEASSGRKFDNSVIDHLAGSLGFNAIRCWFFIKLDSKSRIDRVLSGVPNTTVICVRNSVSSAISLDGLTCPVEGFAVR